MQFLVQTWSFIAMQQKQVRFTTLVILLQCEDLSTQAELHRLFSACTVRCSGSASLAMAPAPSPAEAGS